MRAHATAVAIGVLTLSTGGIACADNMQGMSMAAPSAAKHGRGDGVIKAIDTAAGTLTIQHGPIPAVGWPAMTMTFKAKPAILLKGLRVGQAISFDCTVRGTAADVTAVRPK
jgi:Cu(I)/Ag(I) efflux system protein CusF